MKKISIVLAILAVFLVFSCSNAAGPVDNAGNPVDLAGSWSGTVAYKSAVKYVKPVTFKTENGKDIDFTGSWVKEVVDAPRADYDSTSTTGTVTTTTKYLYNGYTTTTTTTRVIAEDGSYVNTEVEKKTKKARDAIAPVANTILVIDGTKYTYVADNLNTDAANDPAWRDNAGDYLATIAAVTAEEYTTTTAKTVAIAKQANNKYTETATKKYSKVSTVGTSTTKEESTDITVTRDTDLTFGDDLAGYVQTKTGKKPVEYLNDITETLTLDVKADGTYTLKSVAVETQAAAAAAAETETAYAAAERKLSTRTVTTTTTGTVAAWETTTSANGNVLKAAFSSSASTTEVVGTEGFKGSSKTTLVSKFAAGTYDGRILKGTRKDKDAVVKTRLYLNAYFDTDGNGTDDSNVIIFDKAEAAK